MPFQAAADPTVADSYNSFWQSSICTREQCTRYLDIYMCVCVCTGIVKGEGGEYIESRLA